MMLLANRCIRLLLLLLALSLAAGTALADETKTIAGTARRVQQLTVSAGSRSFLYVRTSAGLQVNGMKADEEVFSTLIRQIESAEDGQSAAFQPQDDPLLTVSLSGTDGTHTLQFYADAQDRSRVYVLCSGKADASLPRKPGASGPFCWPARALRFRKRNPIPTDSTLQSVFI